MIVYGHILHICLHANEGRDSKTKGSEYNTHVNFQSFFSRDATLKQRVPSIIRMSIFRAFSAGKKCALYMDKYGMDSKKTKLQIMAEKAINGDEEMNVTSDEPLTLTWENLCADYNYCAHIFLVSTKLGLNSLKRASRMSLKHAEWIARNHFHRPLPPVATTCTIEDLATTMSMVLTDVPPTHLNREEDVGTTSSSEGEPDAKQNKKTEEKNDKKPKKPENPKKSKNTKTKEESGSTRIHHTRVTSRLSGCEAEVCDIKRHLSMFTEGTFMLMT